MKRVAVVGAGIAGLGAAHTLRDEARVTLFEAGAWFGGHAHTVDVTLDGVTHGVDTGFLVFNHRTYPKLVRLFDELGVATAPSQMSFSVQDRAAGLEWSGHDLRSVFAQRRNLLRPRFWAMLAELLRFNRLCTALAEQDAEAGLAEPLGDFLARHRFGAPFRDWYLLPMLACIWSCPSGQMLRFPVATLIRFCHNHGLLSLNDRPQWHTVRGGSRRYVRRMLERIADKRLHTPVRGLRRVPGGVQLATDAGSELFDDVVLACHSDQSLALLGADASAAEAACLGAIRYRPNRAVLHTDAAVLPRRRRAWAAWNCVRPGAGDEAGVCLHYLINRLQPLPWPAPVIVSLNPGPLDPARVIGEYSYSHPLFDLAAWRAQQALPALQGRGHVWFCGAWTRYGFHEDGLASALDAVQRMRESWHGAARREAA